MPFSCSRVYMSTWYSGSGRTRTKSVRLGLRTGTEVSTVSTSMPEAALIRRLVGSNGSNLGLACPFRSTPEMVGGVGF
jgi:hypothetical protein